MSVPKIGTGFLLPRNVLRNLVEYVKHWTGSMYLLVCMLPCLPLLQCITLSSTPTIQSAKRLSDVFCSKELLEMSDLS